MLSISLPICELPQVVKKELIRRKVLLIIKPKIVFIWIVFLQFIETLCYFLKALLLIFQNTETGVEYLIILRTSFHFKSISFVWIQLQYFSLIDTKHFVHFKVFVLVFKPTLSEVFCCAWNQLNSLFRSCNLDISLSFCDFSSA